MKHNFIKILILSISTLFFSCTIEPYEGTIPSDANNTDNPTSQTNDYYPTAVNNTWTMQQNGVNQTPSTIIGTEAIGGFTYYKFSPINVSGISTRNYIRKASGSYYMKLADSNLNFGGLTGTQTGFEFTILKDNIAVGATWNGTYTQTTTYTGIPPINQTTTYTGTILAKGVSETVDGELYNDVIKCKIDQVTTVSGSTSNASTEYWFAKNVGPIKSVISSAGSTTTSILVDYTLF